MSGSENEHSNSQAAPELLPEGDEAPPPGVRTMGFVRWALVAAMAFAAVGSWVAWSRAGTPASASSARAQFHCPMHPTIVQPAQGDCPICGMDLVPVSATTGAGTATAGAPPSTAIQGKYWCPMHPEVASDDPEARCSKCGGMKLLPRESAVAAPTAAPVAGLVPVDVGVERAQKIGVRTAPVKWAAMARTVRATGSITVDEGAVAIVTSRVTGWVEELRVREAGQRVARGEILGTIYSPDLVSAQQVFLSSARLSDRAQAQPTTAGAAFQTTPARRLDLLGVAKQDIDRLEKSGKVETTLPFRSPIAGYVAGKIEAAGAYVQPGTELFRIADLSKVRLLAEVSERDARRVSVGQKVLFIPAAGSGETYNGTVDLVYPALDSGSRMLMVRASFANDRLELRPGMAGDVAIYVPPVQGLTVPREAVIDTGEAQYVFVTREGGRFEPRTVRAGPRDHDHVLLLEGVSEGERVVTTANFLIDAESRVRAAVQAQVQ